METMSNAELAYHERLETKEFKLDTASQLERAETLMGDVPSYIMADSRAEWPNGFTLCLTYDPFGDLAEDAETWLKRVETLFYRYELI